METLTRYVEIKGAFLAVTQNKTVCLCAVMIPGFSWFGGVYKSINPDNVLHFQYLPT